MTTPLPPAAIALADKMARTPSDSPAAACWLANPSAGRVQLDRREQAIEEFLHFIYRLFPPDLADRWKAEAAGLLPSKALELFTSHLDDPLPFPNPCHQRIGKSGAHPSGAFGARVGEQPVIPQRPLS